MAADISDILASIDESTVPQRTLDLQALTRAWINERAAPELLPYPSELIERLTLRVQTQIENIEDMTGSMDPKANFALVIFQTELERFKFLLRSYLRTRLAKVSDIKSRDDECAMANQFQIDKTPLHYRDLALASAPSLANPVLSKLEQQYLAQHQALLSAHYSASFLTSLPASLQKLDDQAGGISMIDKPDQDTAVFCRVLRDRAR